MSLAGASIDQLRTRFSRPDGSFSKATSLALAGGTLQAIEQLHGISFLHRDPGNFALGVVQDKDIIFVQDFGMARSYRTAEGKLAHPRSAKIGFLGTFKYASVRAHKELEQL